MDFKWDDDPFGDDNNATANAFAGFDFGDGNESYSSEIYSDCSSSQCSTTNSAFCCNCSVNSQSSVPGCASFQQNQQFSYINANGMMNNFNTYSPSCGISPSLDTTHQIKFGGSDVPKRRFGTSSSSFQYQHQQLQNQHQQLQNQHQIKCSPTDQMLANNMNNINLNVSGVNKPFPTNRCAPPFFTGKIELAAMDQFKPRSSSKSNSRTGGLGKTPIVQWSSSTPLAARTDQLFLDICLNTNAILSPAKLGFIPSHFWPSKEYAFSDIVFDFFQRKNNTNCRFLHKLYNALKIASLSSTYAELAGVQWVTANVIKVSKGQFARLLGIKSIDGSLFHQQGNFPTHGFVELNREQAQTFCPMADISQIDFDEVRLLIHQPGLFIMNCSELQVRACSSLVSQRKH